MDMSNFWSQVTHKLTFKELRMQHPKAAEVAEADDLIAAEFAFGIIPSLGPGGHTSAGDEEEDSDEAGPSASGDTALMAYMNDVDELYLWVHASNRWLLWNY